MVSNSQNLFILEIYEKYERYLDGLAVFLMEWYKFNI